MIEPGTVFVINKALLDAYYDITDISVYETDMDLNDVDKPWAKSDQQTQREIDMVNEMVTYPNGAYEFKAFVRGSLIPYSDKVLDEICDILSYNVPVTNYQRYAKVYKYLGKRLQWSPTKVVVPKNLKLFDKEQKITYLKEIEVGTDKFYAFEYDGATMRFGAKFMTFLRFCRLFKCEGFRIDNHETYDTIYHKKHEKIYNDALEHGKQIRKDRMELAETNANVLEKYFFPTQHVRPKYDWRFFVELPKVLLKNIFNKLTRKKEKKNV